MDWHTTWQDPIAIICVVACVAFAWWLHRRLGRTTACGSCSAHAPTAPERSPGPPTRAAVPLDALRLGRRR